MMSKRRNTFEKNTERDKKWGFLVDFMAKGITINAETYCETQQKLGNKRRGMLSRGVYLLHDNAVPLANFLDGKCVSNDEGMKATVEKWLPEPERSVFDEGIKKPVPRPKKCIEIDGNCVEK
ncbi:hypothetical protein AAG570_012611 [Ranatra chinensis]|uniref:Uncharacterized protein n=1 Tax=Ranatra chinensis TaxID=642074 RepID=A0ABD0YEN3_9HEMI